MKKIIFNLLFVISFSQFSQGNDIHNAPGDWFLENSSSIQVERQTELDYSVIPEFQTEAERRALDFNKPNHIEALFKGDEIIARQNSTKFFHPYFEFQNANLTCPVLLENYANTHFYMVDKVDFAQGQIVCSVYEKPFADTKLNYAQRATTSFPKLKKVFSQTFTNPLYLNLLKDSYRTMPENLINEGAVKMAQLYGEKLKYAKNVVKYKFTGGDDSYTALDLSDVLDAVMIFDTNIIDLQTTYDMQQLAFNDGYIAAYLDEDLIETQSENQRFINQVSEELNSKFEIFPVVFQENAQKSMEEKKDEISILLSSKLHMVVYFIINYWNYFEEYLWIFITLAAFYGIYNASQYSIANIGKESERKNFKYKLTFSILIVFATFGMFGPWNSIQIEREDDFKEVGLSHVQSSIAALSAYTNDLNDDIAAAIIDSYTSTAFDDIGLSVSQIQATARLYQKSKFIQQKAAELYPQCERIYDKGLIRMNNKDWFSKQTKSNPFVPDEMLAKSPGGYSPYNKVELGGYVKNPSIFAQTSLSVDACYNLANDIFRNFKKINFLEKRIEVFNDMDLKEIVFQQKEAILTNLWSEFYRYGYLGAPMLATVDMYKKIMEMPQKKADEWLEIVGDFNTNKMIQFSLENSILVLTIGDSVQTFAAKIAKLASDGLIGWVPFVGPAFSSVTANSVGFITALLYVDVVIELIPSLRGLFMYAIGSIFIFLTFITKFFVYWLIPFAMVRIFSNMQGDKIAKDLIKVIMVFVKPAIFLFVFFLTLFVMDFFSNYLYLGIDRMVGAMTLGGNALEYGVAYFIKGIAVVFAVIIEFIVCYQLLTKGTKTIIEFFEISANDLTEVLTDGVSTTVQNKVVR